MLFFLLAINLYSFEAKNTIYLSKDITGDRETITDITITDLNFKINKNIKVDSKLYKKLNYKNNLEFSFNPCFKIGNKNIYFGIRKSKKYNFLKVDRSEISLKPNLYFKFIHKDSKKLFNYSLLSFISHRGNCILFNPIRISLINRIINLSSEYKNQISFGFKEKYSTEKELKKLADIEYCIKIKDIIDRRVYFKFFFEQKYSLAEKFYLGLIEKINYSVWKFDISKIDLIIKPFLKMDYNLFDHLLLKYKNELEFIHRFSSLTNTVNINMKIGFKYIM